jgi:hypothetical protein
MDLLKNSQNFPQQVGESSSDSNQQSSNGKHSGETDQKLAELFETNREYVRKKSLNLRRRHLDASQKAAC